MKSVQVNWIEADGFKQHHPLVTIGDDGPDSSGYEIYYRIDDRVGRETENLTVNDVKSMTHKLVAVTRARDLDEIFMYMQGELWSPQGEMREYITRSGHNHTSISVGDVIYSIRDGKWYQVMMIGFEELISERLYKEDLLNDVRNMCEDITKIKNS